MKKWILALVFFLVLSSGCTSNQLVNYHTLAPTKSVCQWVRNVDYTIPIKKSASVEDDYFNDAVFIGDSRAVGVKEYEVFIQTDVLASIGLSINQWKIKKVIPVPESKEKITVWDALALKTYQKIYLIVGYNELGWGYSSVFKQRLQELIQQVKLVQPQAEIILELIYPISEEGLKKEKDTSLEKIAEYNAIFTQLAQEEQIYLLDLTPLVSVTRTQAPTNDLNQQDPSLLQIENQYILNPDFTDDGVHLNTQGFAIWKDYIKTHTVRRENDKEMQCDSISVDSIDGVRE